MKFNSRCNNLLGFWQYVIGLKPKSKLGKINLTITYYAYSVPPKMSGTRMQFLKLFLWGTEFTQSLDQIITKWLNIFQDPKRLPLSAKLCSKFESQASSNLPRRKCHLCHALDESGEEVF